MSEFPELEGRAALIADDEPKIREMLRMELEDHNVKVYEAENGREALEMVQENKIDFIISDVRMPKGSGIELLEGISKMNNNKPRILLVSGFSDLTERMAEELGAIELVSKPYNMQNILQKIVRVLPKE